MLTKAPRSAIEDYWLPPLHWLMDCGTTPHFAHAQGF